MIRRQKLRRASFAVVVGGLFLGLPTAAAVAEEDSSAPADVGAASLSISPLRIEIDKTGTGATVYLTNSSTRELAVQSRLFAWSQDAGNDVYAPSADLTVSPSISMIPPGETQIVRVLRKGAASPGEKRFRLAVDQLPDPTLTRAGEAQARIRFTVPVFVDRDTAAPAALEWRLSDNRLLLANTGGSTARVVSVALKDAAGAEVPMERNTLRYVQGNSTIDWPIGKGCSLGAVHVTAVIDGQTVDAQPKPTCS